MSTILVLTHICGATIGILSGFLAMIVRKGSGLHAAAGTIFFVSMLGMSTSAVIIAGFIRPVPLNVVAGSLTFYLVLTAWWTARHRQGGTSPFDWFGLALALAVGAGAFIFGIRAVGKPGAGPAVAFFIFGSVALLFAASDVRLLARGGVTGARRISRHLTRMCLALLIATLSFFPGQAKLFSKAVRANNFMYVPHLLLVGAMIYWLIRMRRRPLAVTS